MGAFHKHQELFQAPPKYDHLLRSPANPLKWGHYFHCTEGKLRLGGIKLHVALSQLRKPPTIGCTNTHGAPLRPPDGPRELSRPLTPSRPQFPRPHLASVLWILNGPPRQALSGNYNSRGALRSKPRENFRGAGGGAGRTLLAQPTIALVRLGLPLALPLPKVAAFRHSPATALQGEGDVRGPDRGSAQA